MQTICFSVWRHKLSTAFLAAFYVAAGPATAATSSRQSPALQPIADVPGLPRVLLIGDSISIGYTVRVREALRGKANVHRVPDNCGATKKGIEQINNWLGNGKWDVIHFNFGLHDIRRMDGDVVYVPASQYKKNLQELVERMKRTGAKLVWATTTPAPSQPKPGQFRRVPQDVTTYNEIAGRIMNENGVVSNDLYSAVINQTAELQPKGDVHFNSKGYDVLAEQVAKHIEDALPTRK